MVPSLLSVINQKTKQHLPFDGCVDFVSFPFWVLPGGGGLLGFQILQLYPKRRTVVHMDKSNGK